MSRWTHAICDNCWSESPRALEGYEAVRLREPNVEACCFCGDETTSGIFVRADPATAQCRGAGAYHGELPDAPKEGGA